MESPYKDSWPDMCVCVCVYSAPLVSKGGCENNICIVYPFDLSFRKYTKL